MNRALRGPVSPTNAVAAFRAGRPTAPIGEQAVLIADIDAADVAKFQPMRLELSSHRAESVWFVLISGKIYTEDFSLPNSTPTPGFGACNQTPRPGRNLPIKPRAPGQVKTRSALYQQGATHSPFPRMLEHESVTKLMGWRRALRVVLHEASDRTRKPIGEEGNDTVDTTFQKTRLL